MVIYILFIYPNQLNNTLTFNFTYRNKTTDLSIPVSCKQRINEVKNTVIQVITVSATDNICRFPPHGRRFGTTALDLLI